MKKWQCTVCGYIHQGETPPKKCPRCGAPKEKFIEIQPSSDDVDVIHMHYGQKVTYGQDVQVNPFFEDYESLAPFIYNLPVGGRAPLHKHPTTDELFFILKGRIKFTVGQREMIAVPGDLLKGRMDIPHTFENIGDEPAVFLSVKGPKPVDLVKLEN